MTWQEKMNWCGKHRIPFLFIIDFLKHSPIVLELSQVNPKEILYQTPSHTNIQQKEHALKDLVFEKSPLAYADFLKSYQIVQQHLKQGDTYLLNLTFATPILCNLNLYDIFCRSQAPYQLLYQDKFICFSPECFVNIQGEEITTYPMKGTIDASLPNAMQRLLNDEKEKSEHATVVDLLRNDLSLIAKNVRVTKYRYIESIQTNTKKLLQISSEIKGTLSPDYLTKLGTIFDALLPAGSISGAPKQKTLDIIAQAEQYDRAYYSGVFGVFDGAKVESGVMIRFIENKNQRLYFKSGAGITALSKPEMEYEEIVNKIYVTIY